MKHLIFFIVKTENAYSSRIALNTINFERCVPRSFDSTAEDGGSGGVDPKGRPHHGQGDSQPHPDTRPHVRGRLAQKPSKASGDYSTARLVGSSELGLVTCKGKIR